MIFKSKAKPKITTADVREALTQEGFQLADEEWNYKNWHSKFTYICPKGHKHNTSWGNWKQGARCPSCYHERRKAK